LFIPINFGKKIDSIITTLPLWVLVAFGSYSLAIISYNLMTFNDAVAANKSLQQEIEEAKTDLKKRGVTITN